MRRISSWIPSLFAPVLVGMLLCCPPVAAQEKPPEETPAEEKPAEPKPVEVKPVEESTPETRSANPWYMTVVGGVYSGSQLLEIPGRLDLKDSYTFGVSVSKQFAEWTRFMRFEGELQVLKHFGEQDHWEFTGSLNLRWVVFPWNRHVETTVALGEGLSWATQIPALEKADPTNSDNAQLLNYILIEVTFAIPESPWSLVTRIHHRSGVWGLFGHSGSNILEAGIRYRF
jgi:hypothetical protein